MAQSRAQGIDPGDAAADWDRAEAEHDAEENPTCPICGAPRDPRVEWCSPACCACDEGSCLRRDCNEALRFGSWEAAQGYSSALCLALDQIEAEAEALRRRLLSRSFVAAGLGLVTP